MNKQFMSIIAATTLLAACNSNPSADQGNVKEDVLAAHIDTTVNPGEDFFAYANGSWIKNNPIPSDEVTYGIGEMVDKELRLRLLKINADALAKNERTGAGQLIGDFWFSAMDTNTIEKNGITPLRPELERIAALKTREDIMSQAVRMHGYGVDVFFSEGVAQDPKKSDLEAYHMQQGGLGLPNRDYYFNATSETRLSPHR